MADKFKNGYIWVRGRSFQCVTVLKKLWFCCRQLDIRVPINVSAEHCVISLRANPLLAYLLSYSLTCTVGDRSRNFVIGLTDVSPTVKTPTLWDYDVCGQWPGAVGRGATVHLRCADNLPPRRYVILQLPSTNYLNFCELQVFVKRTLLPQSTVISIAFHKYTVFPRFE